MAQRSGASEGAPKTKGKGGLGALGPRMRVREVDQSVADWC